MLHCLLWTRRDVQCQAGNLPCYQSCGEPAEQLSSRTPLQFPALEELGGNFVFSLNQEYLAKHEEQQLKAGDEVAVIPPISGG
jgi:molybdopterin converting factor small subunit